MQTKRFQQCESELISLLSRRRRGNVFKMLEILQRRTRHPCRRAYLHWFSLLLLLPLPLLLLYFLAAGTVSGPPQAPFGRTTSSAFSVALAEEFHCILVASIPRFPFSHDCISVWKRTKLVRGRGTFMLVVVNPIIFLSFARVEGNNSKEDCWVDIPLEDQLPSDLAAPSCRHLL